MLRTVLDQFPGVVYWKDRQSVYLGCNQASATAAGLANPEEIVGKTDMDLAWAATEAMAYRADDRAVMESGQPRLGVIEPQHRSDGSLAWLDTAKVPLMDEKGNVIGVLGTSRDITEQVRTLHALQETEFFLNRSQQVTRIGSYKLDVKSGSWESSPSLDEILGIDDTFPKTVEGWLSLVVSEDRDLMQDHLLRQVLVERQRFEKEYRTIRPSDGQLRWMFGLGELEFDDTGRPTRMIGTIQDITERKMTEVALQQATLIVENSPVILFRWRATEGWPVVLVSQNVIQFGYTPEEFLGGSKMFSSIVHPDDLERVGQEVRDHVASGVDRFLQEYRIVAKDGRVRWIEDRTMVERDVNGLVTHYQGLVVDVTDRKQAEMALFEKSEELDRFFSNVLDLLCIADTDGHFLRLNTEWERSLGYTASELVGRNFLDFVHPEDQVTTLAAISILKDGGDVFNFINRYRCKDGSYRWIEWRSFSAGSLIYAAARDITERKQIEDRLRESEERLQQAIRVSNIGIFDHDQTTDFIYWSPEVRKGFGIGLDETFTLPDFINQIYPDDIEGTGLAIQRAHDPAGDGSFDVEYRFVRRDGVIRWFAAKSQTFFEGDGNSKHPVRTIGALVDITERKRIEGDREALIDELESKNAELERFTYTVSHDLKSPLVTIKGFLGFLKQDIASGNMERFDSDLERIGNATKKMERLLWDLLELSRIGRLVKPSEEIPFESLVQEALEIVHGQLDARGVTVHVQPNLPAVYGDRQRLTEVLQNLLDNAAKYMGDQKKPYIEIGLHGLEGGKSVFFVRDNGIGIAPEHHERIFGLFNKLDVRSEGTGVGLALVKRIIEFHGGRIWVDSEGNGLGTTFYFTLQAPPEVDREEKESA